MRTQEFQDKFISFVDVLGFKSMIEGAEQGMGRTLAEIKDILKDLEREKDKIFYEMYGPQICPRSSCLHKDLSFQVTQVSDCAIASAEVSPAGVINLVNYCWAATMTLLTKGVMVRGYITRGRIYHSGNAFMGSGYHHAYQREANVSAFKREADEKGTPFVEVDPAVCDYVQTQTDDCVRMMFARFVKVDGELTALFPFQSLSHSFAIGGFGAPPFDAAKEKANNDKVRTSLQRLKEKVLAYVDPANVSTMRKATHYVAALDEQLSICDQTDEAIDHLLQPFPAHRFQAG